MGAGVLRACTFRASSCVSYQTPGPAIANLRRYISRHFLDLVTGSGNLRCELGCARCPRRIYPVSPNGLPSQGRSLRSASRVESLDQVLDRGCPHAADVQALAALNVHRRSRTLKRALAGLPRGLFCFDPTSTEASARSALEMAKDK